eukprot:scaffold476_cov81-Skeletonema_dohrnii-CCMP3373.AAC.1
MVATGYDYGVPPVVHADLKNDDLDSVAEQDDESGGTAKQKRTPRLEMDEVFFGDTFGEPLELLQTLRQGGEEEAA